MHGAHHNTKHDFFSQCMLNERVMILCVVWKGFRHLPEILGEGVAPWLSWCCDTGKREGGTVEKAEGQLVWPQSGEGPQRARKKEWERETESLIIMKLILNSICGGLILLLGTDILWMACAASQVRFTHILMQHV